jgi:hypothetical protein
LARDHSRHFTLLANFYGHHVTLDLNIDLKDCVRWDQLTVSGHPREDGRGGPQSRR